MLRFQLLRQDAYEDAVRYAQQFPDAGTDLIGPELGRSVRKFPLQGFPFYLVTSVVGETLVVIAVAHAKRKPGYWLQRIQ